MTAGWPDYTSTNNACFPGVLFYGILIPARVLLHGVLICDQACENRPRKHKKSSIFSVLAVS